MLDSTCSYHCSYQECFDAYKPCNVDTVMMGNGFRCKAVGVGT